MLKNPKPGEDTKSYALKTKWEYDRARLCKKVIKQLTSIEYSLVFSRPYDGQVHMYSVSRSVLMTNQQEE